MSVHSSHYLWTSNDLPSERRRRVETLYGEFLISRRQRIDPQRRIAFASLYVTGRCHLRCPHCHAEENFTGLGLDKDVPTETLVAIINVLTQSSDRIQLTGGEILQRREPGSGRNDIPLL